MSIATKRILPILASMLFAAAPFDSRPCMAQDPDKSANKENQDQGNARVTAPPTSDRPLKPDAAPKLAGPPPIEEVQLVPVLPTVPVRRDRAGFNVQMVNTALTPRDKEGIWVLDFSFKPLRIVTVEVPGRRLPVHYLYYKVVNRTGKPRTFVPQFIMVNEEGKRFEDSVIPEALPLIQAREDRTIPLRGAVNIMGVIPPSTKEGVDDAVYGVAVWDRWDLKADRFSIFVRGLSDGYKEVPNPSGGKSIAKYKTLQINFIRRGDERNISEKEIEFAEKVYDWVYW